MRKHVQCPGTISWTMAALLAGTALAQAEPHMTPPSLEDALPLEWGPPPLPRDDPRPKDTGVKDAGLKDTGPETTGAFIPADPAPDAETLLPLEWGPPPMDGVIAEEQTRRLIGERLTAGTAPDGIRKQRDFEAVAAVYAERGNRPFWTDGAAFTPAAEAAAARIRRAGEDGLDPAAFGLPDLKTGSPEELADADIRLSLAVAAFAREAQSGRIKPGSVSGFITVKPERPDTAAVLEHVTGAADVAAALDSYNPPHKEFHALRAALATARAQRSTRDLPELAGGRSLRPGDRDARVPVLRARLELPAIGADSPDANLYDDALAGAVRAFQESKGLNPESVVGPLTVAALNAELERDLVADILVNMERWRWMPRDLGKAHIFVNVPDYRLQLRRDGETVHETKAIVGTLKTQTPIFSDAMSYMVVNPSWGVPYSIVKRDMLPELINDPTYLQRRGINVYYTSGGRTHQLDSTRIDWTSTSLRGLNFRQPPGSANALGQIKFMFPNEHAVYLHDTPTRKLFDRDVRTLSNGCVRVQNPFDLAQVILETTGGMDIGRVKAMVGKGGEKRVNLPEPLPIHLAYFTVWIDADGTVVTRDDVYGHDRRMRQSLADES